MLPSIHSANRSVLYIGSIAYHCVHRGVGGCITSIDFNPVYSVYNKLGFFYLREVGFSMKYMSSV